jgi:hypothetical protein
MAETTWTPYVEKMKEVLEALPLTGTKSIQGRDIAAAAGSATLQAFTAEKIEKIVLGAFPGGASNLGLCSIIPAEGYDLPIFFSRWEEGKSSVGIFVDLLPTVDILVDEPYRKKYIEPLGEIWGKFSNLSGITPEDDDDLRACCSIVYTAAVIPIEREGMRLAALAPHTDYLKHYIEFYAAAAAAGDAAKRQEIQRKTAAVKKTLREHVMKIAAGPAGQGLAPPASGGLAEIFF